jgi:endonuclease YncB( thermonuclease family)
LFSISSNRKAPLVGAFLLFTLTLFLQGASADQSQTVEVSFVLDGDTVILQGGERVRLIGINAPEKEYAHRPAQPYALEALLALRELVQDEPIVLVKGKQDADSYGRTLGYLESADGTDLQQVLVARGYAFVVAFPPDIDRLEQYLDAERTARANRLGVWNVNQFQPVDLDLGQTLESGFGLYRGRVLSVGRSRKNVRLAFGSDLVVTIRHTDWKSYWSEDPDSLEGKSIELRGWLRKAGKNDSARYYLRLRHPYMMRIVK